MYRVLVNILATVMLTIATSWTGLYAYCAYNSNAHFCRQDSKYIIVGASAVFIVLGSFLIQQYNKVNQLHFQIKKKPDPMPAVVKSQRSINFNSIVKLMWDGNTTTIDTADSLVDYGWNVGLDNGDYLPVSQRKFFHWLTQVVRDQIDLKLNGELSLRSPLSQRRHAYLGRTRWRVYRMLLAEVNALEKLNSNIVVLKDEALDDPWRVIKAIEVLRPLEEL